MNLENEQLRSLVVFEHAPFIRRVVFMAVPHRGATIFMAYLMIGAYVAFVRVRPVWQVIALVIAAAPILLICNATRLALWGVIAIYSGSHPLSQTPRILATVTALLLAYVLFGVFAWLLAHVFMEGDGPEAAPAKG